ncbi:hypothetical protein HDU79_004147 [Rhizoclosmatium sp. JEL0117]|nr:hypothetical protein HDU79_004147 [Rhizoclosmatium sp. JEL0117]
MFSTAPRAVSTSTKKASSPNTNTTRPGPLPKKTAPISTKISPNTSRKSTASSSSKPSTQSTIAPAAEPKTASTKISTRSVPKAILDLGNGSHKTAFSAAYSKGGFPCRLEHGSVKHKISWSQPIHTLSYNPLLITLMEGLRENKHPFLFLVPTSIQELLLAPDARPKIEPILAQCIPPLRHALSSKDKCTILSSLTVTKHLAECMGASLLPYLPSILPPIALHSHSRDTQVKESVTLCLQGIESGIALHEGPRCIEVQTSLSGGGVEKGVKTVNVGEWIGVGGGERGVGGVEGVEALKMIKAKVPTYSSVFG